MCSDDSDAIHEVIRGNRLWCVVCGDNAIVTAGIPSGSIDAVITDIPYGTASESKVQTHSGVACESFNLEWDREMPLDWLAEAFRMTVEGGSLMFFCDNAEVTTAINAARSAGWHFLQTFYWVKTNPPPQPRKNFCSGIETAIFCRKPGKIAYWGGGGATLNWYSSGLVRDSIRIHETQKDSGLMRQIVRCLCPVGGIVLDPFCGGGTTGVACGIEGVKFIGIEIDPEKADNARNRIGPEAPLFGTAKPKIVEEELL